MERQTEEPSFVTLRGQGNQFAGDIRKRSGQEIIAGIQNENPARLVDDEFSLGSVSG